MGKDIKFLADNPIDLIDHIDKNSNKTQSAVVFCTG